MEKNVQNISTGNEIQILFKDIENNKEERILQAIGNIFISGSLYIGIILSLISMFNIESVSYVAIVSGLVFIFIINYFLDNLKIFSRFLTILILVSIGLLVFRGEYVKNGLFLTMNQIRNVVGMHTGFVMNQYDISISSETYQIAIIYFWSFLSLIIAFICALTVKNNSSLLLWVVVLPLFIVEVFTGIMPNFIYNLILFFAVVLLANYSFIGVSENNKMLGKSKNSMILYVAFMIFLLFLVFSLVLIVVKPVSNYSKNSIVVNIKNNVEDKVQDFRYEKNKTNTFTQGNFRKLGKLELLNSKALEVTMDKPTSLYLKGYIGSEYTKEGWTDLDSSIYYNSYELFYWLHKYQFNSLNQLSSISDLMKDSKDKNEKIDISVNNINANSKYLYVPYELDTELDNSKDIKIFNDSKLMSTSFKGKRKYKYKSNTNLVKKYPLLASNLYGMKDEPKIKEYLKNESHYNEFVYENYTRIPKAIESLFENQLGKVPKTEDGHIPYEKAIEVIKKYLNQNIKYTVDPEPVPKDRDFLKYFLEESKEGYATHYATTATTMFRYFGIPSRYVEGYLITPKDVKDISEYKPININGTNAHAWTEIYIDEIGWIPIEVTPPYYNVMESVDTSQYPGGGSLEKDKNNNSPSDSTQGKQQIIDDEQKPHTKSKEDDKRTLTTLEKLGIGISLLLLITILIYIIYVVKNRRKLKEMEESFEDSNYKLAIPRLFAYSMFLMHYDGLSKKGGSTYGYIEDIEEKYSKKYVKIFKKAISINQEAIFSSHEISEEQYEYMTRFKNQILYDLIESKNIFQRMKMKFWDFIY